MARTVLQHVQPVGVRQQDAIDEAKRRAAPKVATALLHKRPKSVEDRFEACSSLAVISPHERLQGQRAVAEGLLMRVTSPRELLPEYLIGHLVVAARYRLVDSLCRHTGSRTIEWIGREKAGRCAAVR